MTQDEFHKLSEELSAIASLIPLHWGDIQNDVKDSELNLFGIHSYKELEQRIVSLSELSKQYFRRRWFLWKCSQCDEFLFYSSPNVNRNPNCKDQLYDVEFNHNTMLRFDIKGTHIPSQFLSVIDDIIANPYPMVKFFYEKQSKGGRHNIQNRLFIIHHSFVDRSRENMLRCKFDFKRNVFSTYSKFVSPTANFISYNNCLSDVIFVLEHSGGVLDYKFSSL